MTRDQAKELLPVIQAFAEGRTIQLKSRRLVEAWHDTSPHRVGFLVDEFDYRIKPEPREWWLVVSRNPVMRETVCNSLNEATIFANQNNGRDVVHVREVID